MPLVNVPPVFRVPWVFAVLAPSDNRAIDLIVLQSFGPDDFIQLGTGQFLVYAASSTEELSDALGITTPGGGVGPTAPALVLRVEEFSGTAAQAVWDWLRPRMTTGGSFPPPPPLPGPRR